MMNKSGNLFEFKGMRPPEFKLVTSPVHYLKISKREMGSRGIDMGYAG